MNFLHVSSGELFADILRAKISKALSEIGVSGVKKNLLFACVLS